MPGIQREGAVYSGGSKGVPQVPAPSMDQNFLNFMQFFWENLPNLYVGAPS